MGGSKPAVLLRGRPLIDYPLRALRAVLDEVVVIAKPDVPLPSLPGTTVWIEPAEPRHPLAGIVTGLALAGGSSVLVCPVDLPLVGAALIERLARADPAGAPAVIATDGQRSQPLLGRYGPEAAEPLAAASRSGQPVRETVAAIHPRQLCVRHPDELFNVNSPEDLLLAQALLRRHAPIAPGEPRT